ncbi:MAG: hypothetical protein QF670_04570 [Alphaproteobacteria bacterium]|nr:hypothetical protein [Alphaproteobacteria bacterium]
MAVSFFLAKQANTNASVVVLGVMSGVYVVARSVNITYEQISNIGWMAAITN